MKYSVGNMLPRTVYGKIFSQYHKVSGSIFFVSVLTIFRIHCGTDFAFQLFEFTKLNFSINPIEIVSYVFCCRDKLAFLIQNFYYFCSFCCLYLDFL